MKSINIILILAILFFAPVEVFSKEKFPTVQLRVLASHIAHKIVSAAVEDCSQRGYLVSAAVVDRNGNLAAFFAKSTLRSAHHKSQSA